MAGLPEAKSDPKKLVDIEKLANKARDERLARLEEKVDLLVSYVEELLPYARRAANMLDSSPLLKLREAFRGR